MKKLNLALFVSSCLLSASCLAAPSVPNRYVELIRYIQPAPDQGETNTCWFMASTGAMELLLNQKNNITRPKVNGPYDLSESFVIYQKDFYDSSDPQEHFIENVVARFNHGEAILHKDWPVERNTDKSANWSVWYKHTEMATLPRIKIPAIKSTLLFARGKRYATEVLKPADLETMKMALATKKAPLIVNYNDDGFWHVILIVGYSDKAKGVCYELEKEECNERGAFVVRDSDGKRYEWRAYNWFLKYGNAAAVVELK